MIASYHRLLIIGLDGATLDLVDPWMRAGYLPTLSMLKQKGGAGHLRSVLPVLSPAAWASFTTGVNPGAHGVYDFAQRLPDSYRLRLTTAQDLRAPSLWRLLSDAGKRVAVVNVPMTWPPESVNGVMVTGLGTPDQKTFTYPVELGNRLLARGYRVNKTVSYRPGAEKAFLKDTYDMTRRVANASQELLKQEPWDLFMLVFRDSDEMSHFFWKHMDSQHPAHNPKRDPVFSTALLEYYQYLDRLAGELIESAGPDVNVIVMSDHGAGPLYKDVFLNEWLRQQGLLVVDSERLKQVGGNLGRLGLTRSNISSSLQRIGLASFERKLRLALGEKINVLPKNKRAIFPDAIDWRQTRAYSFGYHGQIFLNVRGREPYGIVEPGTEYTHLRGEITELLRKWVDPEDGKPVVSDIIVQEMAFQGPYAEAGADLTVIMRDLAYITRQGYEFADRPGQILSPPSTYESGSHRLDGMLFVAGPDWLTSGDLPIHSIIDLAPTILHLLGLPVAEHMEGSVLTKLLVPTRQVYTKSHYDGASVKKNNEGLTAEEEREITERLRNLGYLE